MSNPYATGTIIGLLLLLFAAHCGPTEAKSVQYPTVVANTIRVVEVGGASRAYIYEFSPRPGVLCFGSSVNGGSAISCVPWTAVP